MAQEHELEHSGRVREQGYPVTTRHGGRSEQGLRIDGSVYDQRKPRKGGGEEEGNEERAPGTCEQDGGITCYVRRTFYDEARNMIEVRV